MRPSMGSSTAAKVRPFPRPSAHWKPYNNNSNLTNGDDDDDDEDESATFSGMQNTAADVDAIEREVDAELARLLDPSADFHSSTQESHHQHHGTNDEEDDETEVDAFVSHRPEYQRSVVAKKLQLYEKQLAVREKQLARLQTQHLQALASITTLKEVLETQNKEFEDAQEDWEQEKSTLLRFRPGGGGGTGETGAASLFQMKMGTSAAALAAKRSKALVNDSEAQRHRLQMLHGAVEVQDQLDGNDGLGLGLTRASGSSTKVLWRKIKRFVWHKLYPFASDVRQIDARFGSSVASYFRFFRWIIMSFVALSIPCVVSLVLHILVLKTLEQYGVEVDWTSFVGVAPAFLLFPRYHPVEGMVYTLVLVVMQALLLLFTIRKWIAEDRESKTLEAIDGSDKKPAFGKIVLNAWDFTVVSQEQASDLKKSIAERIKVTFKEDELAETLRKRTSKERYKLYARRATAFLIYVVVQVASWYLIILVTTQSAEIQQDIALKARFLAPYVSSIVPAMVTLINGLLPTIITLLTSLEKWDDVGFAIKAMVTRLYLAKVLNVLIQLVSYGLLLDPYLLTGTTSLLEIVEFDGAPIRKNVMLAFKPDIYSCRAEQVASGLLSLVVTDFVVGKVVAITLPGVMWSVNKVGVLWKQARDRRRAAKVAPGPDSAVPTDNSTATDIAKNESTRPASSTGKAPISRPPSAVPTDSDSKDRTAAFTGRANPTPVVTPHASSSTPTQSLLSKAEFQVPQKMVALLYSCTIALVAIPLAPTAALLALLLHVINFKFDKFFLMALQKKPTNPWSAKDAGSFFIKFYFCTVSIFMGFTHFFLSNTSLPKSCELQDSLLQQGSTSDATQSLCLSGTFDSTTELCALDPANSKSAYFLSTVVTKNECDQGYPKCICSPPFACGPFVGVVNGYAPLLSSLLSVRPVSSLYKIVASSAFVAWGFVLLVLMASFFLRNSLNVHALIAHAREHEVAITFASLRKKIKQLENRLRVHKISAQRTVNSDETKPHRDD